MTKMSVISTMALTLALLSSVTMMASMVVTFMIPLMTVMSVVSVLVVICLVSLTDLVNGFGDYYVHDGFEDCDACGVHDETNVCDFRAVLDDCDVHKISRRRLFILRNNEILFTSISRNSR
jgi:hypothetical protein